MLFTFTALFFVYVATFIFALALLFWFVTNPMKTFYCVIRDFIGSSSRYMK